MKKFLNRFIVQFKCDWLQLLHKFNWYSFNFIYIYFEYEKITEGLEFHFYLLGFCFYIRYNLPASDKIFAKFDEEISKIKIDK